jgi:hypothetical protein
MTLDYEPEGDTMHNTVETPVRDGKVDCPYYGQVDVETCYRCPRLRAFYDDDDGTMAVCAAPPRLLTRLLPRLGPSRTRSACDVPASEKRRST